MKHKHVTPEQKLLQAIAERYQRYKRQLVILRGQDYYDEAYEHKERVLEAKIKELGELMRLFAAYGLEATNHGDCVPVTGQTVMELE